ncbi:MAG TPA: c-type cytochrome [Rhizomicrobium sp.]|nr:c-type cytochrome [Rhizomicrobium sp.]
MLRRWGTGVAGIVAIALLGGAAVAPKDDPPPDWAFVVFQPSKDPPVKGDVTVPGSKLHVAAKVLDDPSNEPDWFAEDHPTMPSVVAHGHAPKLWGCAYCHLPTGIGGPESAVIAGLPAGYIEQQFAEFHAGRRQCPVPKDNPCATSMQKVSAAITEPELEAAAAYFSGLKYHSRIHVIEAARVPKTEVEFFARIRAPSGGEEAIGQRILEVPDDRHLYNAGDWRTTLTAYVPPGSIARGRSLVESGDGAVPCSVCHGAHMQGAGLVPPLAGRSPSYLYRQLYEIQYGYRHGPAVAQMLPEVAHLNAKDRIAIVAYLASLKE